MATVVLEIPDGQMGQYLWANEGLTDLPVIVWAAESSQLAKGFYFKGRWEIAECEMDKKEARFTLGPLFAFSRTAPRNKYERVDCQWHFGGPLGRDGGCGFDTLLPGALQVCTKLEEGKNGCKEHGDDEVRRGLPRKHPRRMRVFQGIPKLQN